MRHFYNEHNSYKYNNDNTEITKDQNIIFNNNDNKDQNITSYNDPNITFHNENTKDQNTILYNTTFYNDDVELDFYFWTLVANTAQPSILPLKELVTRFYHFNIYKTINTLISKHSYQ